jgi:diguanylate cyclase
VVAKLIEVNQHMQEKLASTEDKLREQAQQIESHAVEARTDALTLLANRWAFDDELARRFAEFRRQGRPFSIIMADVDNFKRFNDTHGHPAGDDMLRAVAKVLRRKMREVDTVTRYGGEEFAIILPGVTRDDACRAALRACQAIEQSQLRREAMELRVTASFGVAEVLPHENAAALVSRVDKALYAAKEGGRNCVHCHDRQTIEGVAVAGAPASREDGKVRQPAAAPMEQTADRSAPPAATAQSSDSQAALAAVAASAADCELLTRTTFCLQVRSRLAEWTRGGPTFSVVLAEVDQYEQCEKFRGQKARELAARAAAAYLASTVRDMDMVGQYAPGCFAMLLPTAGLANAIQVAERLREGFSHYTLWPQGEQLGLTMSIGVAQVIEDEDSVSLLRRAEAALDAADRRGGNRAYYHDGERCAPITAMLETLGYLT